MPRSDDLIIKTANIASSFRRFEAMFKSFEKQITVAMKQQGFSETLKSLKKNELQMMTVEEGVLEKLPSGLYDAALQTDDGPVVLKGAYRANHDTTDPQLFSSNETQTHDHSDSYVPTAEELIAQLVEAGSNPPYNLLCELELTIFDSYQKEALLPLLWQYILNHRNSNSREVLVAVGAAIRKYIAIMPLDRMSELAVLLDSGSRSPLPIDLEIEVAKMIYRNFEVHPPKTENPHPELAQQLLEIAQAYTNPRILLKDKHSAAASLAIEAIFAMRSPLAEQAWITAVECPYQWFSEIVNDNLNKLHELWQLNTPEAANWLCDLRSRLANQK